MFAAREFKFTPILQWTLKWRFPLLAFLVVGYVWWTTPTWHPYLQSSPYKPLRALGSTIASSARGDPYTENGISLATFSALTCDWDTLPDRVRMIRPTGETYWLFGHGFDDLVTNENWVNGWEVNFADQLELYLRAIKDLEDSRSIFIDMGANIGTRKQHWVFVHVLPSPLQFYLMYSVYSARSAKRKQYCRNLLD
jgi:hypothetical protein